MKKFSFYEILLALVLFVCFVGTSFYIILLGANSYKTMVDKNEEINKFSIISSYYQNNFDMALNNEKISIVDKNNTEFLIIDYDNYYKVIYYYDGFLYDVILKDLDNLDVNIGDKVTNVDNIDIIKINTHEYELTIKNNEIVKKMSMVVR